MGFAENKFLEYLRENLPDLLHINVEELLDYLTPCLTTTTTERLHVFVRNRGNRSTVMDFYLALSRSEKWVIHFIKALRSCGHNELADNFEEVYSSYQLPNSRQSSPQSLPPTLSHNNRQPSLESPQHNSSLPGQMPAASQPGPSPKPSPRVKQIQPVQAMTGDLPSQQDQEFKSLPPFTHKPRPPPGTSEPRNSEPVHSEPVHLEPVHSEPRHSEPVHLKPVQSEPVHLNRRTLEDDTFRNPVPETTPYQPEGQDEALQKDQSSIPEHPHSEPDPLPRDRLSPSFKSPQPKVSTPPSSENVSPAKVPETRTTPSYSPPTSSEGAAANGSRQPAHNKTEKLPERDPAYMTVNSGLGGHGRNEQQREQAAIHKAASRPEQPVLPSNVRSVREKDGGQRNGRPAYQEVADVPDSRPANRETTEGEPGRERPAYQQVADVPDSRPEQPVLPSNVRSVREKDGGQRNGRPAYQEVADVPDSRPANRETTEGEPGRERPAYQQVPSGSSCRPLDNNNDEEYFSKPGALDSTLGFAGAPWDGLVSSVMSSNPELQLSDSSEGSGSSKVVDRSSTSITHNKAPTASTPNTRSMQIEDRKSPEENYFMYDSKSSPVRNRRLDHSPSNQPEENSFGRVSHYRLQFNEEPEGDLMEGNDDTLRSRPKKVPSSMVPNDDDTQQKTSKNTEGRDRERTLLLTITVASVCLSLYLLWKSRQN